MPFVLFDTEKKPFITQNNLRI